MLLARQLIFLKLSVWELSGLKVMIKKFESKNWTFCAFVQLKPFVICLEKNLQLANIQMLSKKKNSPISLTHYSGCFKELYYKCLMEMVTSLKRKSNLHDFFVLSVLFSFFILAWAHLLPLQRQPTVVTSSLDGSDAYTLYANVIDWLSLFLLNFKDFPHF